jgi:PIN domain nuclease of toxin-antitoxin system
VKRLLLDTEVLIWWDADDPRLGPSARTAIQQAEDVCVSAASAWEIAIKQGLGKLQTRRQPGQAVVEGGFSPLPVTFEHAEAVGALPKHHNDPFDRLIIAVAQVEALAIVTSDDRFTAYGCLLIDARA